jgi:ABC-type multidrug transport system permease subunit
MLDVLRDTYSVFWVELKFLGRNWHKTLATTLVAPVLYLLAFGYGLGNGVTVEGYNYLEFVIPGIIALTAMTTSFNAAGMKLHVDRLFYKCFDEALMSPISFFSIVVGKSLIGVVRGLLSAGTLLLACYFLSPISMVNALFWLTLVVTCFVFSFLGVLVALVSKSHQDMSVFMSLVILPMSFLSGTFFSLASVPGALRVVISISPLTHTSLCLRAAALGQVFPWFSLGVLLGFGGLFFGLCFVALRRVSV